MAADAKRGTRERVLDAALDLFNRRGAERVTTAEIARSVAINEGNLYYHFRTKEALVLALFARFEADAAGFMAGAASGAPRGAAGYAGLLAQWFQLAWCYRFFFRDLLALTAMAPGLAVPIRSLSARLREAVESIVDAMVAEGLMVLAPTERQPLLANVWIVSTYWAVYLNLQEGVESLDEGHLAWGLGQVASLFRPHLTPAALAALEG